MIISKRGKIIDVRYGRTAINRVYSGFKLVWQRLASSLYLRVTPQQLWLPEDILQGDVDVLSNTEWVAAVDAGWEQTSYLILDATQLSVAAAGADFEVHVSSNTSWSVNAFEGLHILEVSPQEALLPPRAGAVATLQVQCDSDWYVKS